MKMSKEKPYNQFRFFVSVQIWIKTFRTSMIAILKIQPFSSGLGQALRDSMMASLYIDYTLVCQFGRTLITIY